MTEKRADAETAELGNVQNCRQRVIKLIVALEDAARALIGEISRTGARRDVPGEYPPAQVARALADHELLSLFAWTRDSDDDANMVINAEVRRRAAEHRERARRLAGLLGEVELVPILAERARSSS